MKLKSAIEGYLLFKASRASSETIKTDRSHLGQFLEWHGDRELQSIRAQDIREYLEYQEDRGLSPYTVRRHQAALSALFNWLTDSHVELAEDNPVEAVRPPKLPKLKPKALRHEDIEALLGAAEKAIAKRRAKAIILFLLDTGCRASELCGVTMDDVDFRTGKVLVTGKGSKQRFVYLGKRALSAVWLYSKDERPEPAKVHSDHLFLTVNDYPLTRHTLRGVIVRLADRVGVHATPHMFRHTAAILHLKNGMDLVSLQHLLGHNDVSTTRGYLEALKDEDVEDKARRTSPSDNWRL